MFIVFLVFVAPTLLLFCLCSLLAIWLAFGRTHVFIRMPAFLFGTLALGLVLCFAATETSEVLFICRSGRALGYASGVVLLATSLARTTPMLIRVPAFLYGTLMLLSLLWRADAYTLDSSWIVRISLATSLVAATAGTLRLFRFRLVDLTDGVSNLEIERATGSDLDEWIAVLDGASAESLNHAEIMAFLRQYGLEFSWQKVVTAAYEKAIGQRGVVQTADGRLHTVVQETRSTSADCSISPTEPQFTIWQLMLATFCAASLLGFVRVFDWHHPTIEDYRFGVPMTVGAATITLSALLGCLAIRHIRRTMAIASVVVLGTAVSVPYAMGFKPRNILYFYLLAAVLAYAVLLMAALILVRHRGYRVVRVQSRERALGSRLDL